MGNFIGSDARTSEQERRCISAKTGTKRKHIEETARSSDEESEADKSHETFMNTPKKCVGRWKLEIWTICLQVDLFTCAAPSGLSIPKTDFCAVFFEPCPQKHGLNLECGASCSSLDPNFGLAKASVTGNLLISGNRRHIPVVRGMGVPVSFQIPHLITCIHPKGKWSWVPRCDLFPRKHRVPWFPRIFKCFSSPDSDVVACVHIISDQMSAIFSLEHFGFHQHFG